MKKGLLSLIILIVLGGLGGYYYVGVMAEKEFKQGIGELNAVLEIEADGSKVNVSIQNYNRGFFTSKADLVLNMDVQVPSSPNSPAMRMPSLSYPIKLSIEHGPFLIGQRKLGIGYAKAHVSVPEKMKGMVKMLFSDESTLPSVDMSWYINFNQDSTFQLSIPSFKLVATGHRGTFNWKGLDTHLKMTEAGKKIKGATIINGLELESQRVNFTVAESRFDYDMHHSPEKMWLGEVSFKLPAIDMISDGKAIFKLTDFTMKTHADVKQALLNMGMISTLTKCVVMGQAYGPGVFDMALNGFHAKTFSELQLKIQAINNPTYSKAQKQQMLMALMPEFVKLIANGASVELRKLTLTMPEGDLSANAKLSVPKNITLKDPVHLMSQLDLVAHVSIPKTILKTVLVNQAKNKIVDNQRLLKATKLSDGTMDETSLANDTNQDTDSSSQETKSADNTTESAQQTTSSSTVQSDTNNKILSSSEIQTLATQQGEAQLEKLVDHNLLKDEGNNYVIDLTFNKGHLMVNGHAASPDILKQ